MIRRDGLKSTGVQIRYMGAKHGLANVVADVIGEMRPGSCLDLFSGMCSVAGAISRRGREAWCNDIQNYASIVSNTLITASYDEVQKETLPNRLQTAFRRNRSSLETRFSKQLQSEKKAIQNKTSDRYLKLSDAWKHAGNSSRLASELLSLSNASKFPFRLATLSYAYGYFGLQQSIDIDSLRYAIDFTLRRNLLTLEEANLSLAALIQTASKIGSAPGHFAQYLEAKTTSAWENIRRQRRRIVWEVFLDAIYSIRPFGSSEWRVRNRVFREDALKLVGELSTGGQKPRIVYADPPYSEAQYSRYYHVLENLVNYNYPQISHKGRYFNERFSTPFSTASLVGSAFRSLVEQASCLRADLVISYPPNGFYLQRGGNLLSLLRDFYPRVDLIEVDHVHSTLGGKHGRMSSNVKEVIWTARVKS